VADLEYLEALEEAEDLRAVEAAKEESQRTGEAGATLDEVLDEFGLKR
jgi:hypothetical protein